MKKKDLCVNMNYAVWHEHLDLLKKSGKDCCAICLILLLVILLKKNILKETFLISRESHSLNSVNVQM